MRPDSSLPELVVSRNGLVQSKQTAQGLVTTYHYDALRRVVEEINPRYGSAHPIQTAYYTTNSSAASAYAIYTSVNGANGQVAWRKDAAGNQTSYTYSATDGRQLSEVNALNKAVHTSYNLRGQVLRQWGPATYPVEYEYNDYGERTKMSTFRTAIAAHTTDAWGATTYPSTTGDTTTWAYDAATGLLLSKTDAAPKTVAYTYDIRGNLKTRTWARNVVTTYTYSSVTGEQTAISYSDGTPGTVYDYNRLGQNTSVVQGTGTGALTSIFARCICGKVTRETFDPTFFGNQVLTYKLDTTGTGTKGRTVGYKLGVADNYALNADYSYGYDDYGRFSTLGLDGEPTPYTYTYLDNSNLISSVTGSAAVQNFTYESYRDHLVDVTTIAGGATSAQASYVVDALGRRTSVVNAGEIFSRYSGSGHHTLYSYNDRSEVTSAQTWTGLNLSDTSTASALGGRKFDFAFDPIGNRVAAKVDNRQTDYTTNALNQYVSRTVPRAVDVTGLASGPASVTVNGAAAARIGDYFSSTMTASSNSASWLSATIAASPGGTQTRNAYVPPAPETNGYDDDGNLTDDSRWHYTWDAENRLTSMETSIAAYTAGAPRQYLSFKYDYLGRRIRKTVASWNGTAYVAAVDRKFIYDGWNLIAEYDVLTTFTMVRTYVWGLDISRTLAEAGGVKGLLMVRDWSTGQSHQTIYDGNGNLLGLVQRETGGITAQYEYSPFGELLRATGSYAASNPFRFSTKFTDDETGLVYYGSRYYDPKQGRFVGKDLIEEKGGRNLYAFVRNNPGNLADYLGMVPIMMDPVTVTASRVRDSDFQYPDYLAYDGGGGGDGGGGPTMMAPFIVRASRCRTVATYGHIGNGNGYSQIMRALNPDTNDAILITPLQKLNAQLSKTVYGGANNPLPEGIELTESFTTPEGLNAALYRDTVTGANILAFAGTAGLTDIGTDIQQAYGLASQQYDQAIALARDLSGSLNGNLSFTGHSLGGGLASAAAIATNLRATTFNAAGLHENTLSRNRISLNDEAAERLITAIGVSGEILGSIQDNNPLNAVPRWSALGIGPQAVGFRISLDQKAAGGPIQQHFMDSALAAIDCL